MKRPIGPGGARPDRRAPIFLSYRRADAAGHAGRIVDVLERTTGADSVFRDVDDVPAGGDFVVALERALAAARVCLVLIGDAWQSVRSADGRRRIDDPEDYVHREIAMALARPDLVVIPLLVNGARMPAEHELPTPLQGLARRQAIELSEQRWDYDISQLVGVLQEAGVSSWRYGRRRQLLRFGAALIGFALLVVLVLSLCCRAPSRDALGGFWYLPGGSHWTVSVRDDQLWIEETHYESRQVWKRGSAVLAGRDLSATLQLVFERDGPAFSYRLQLSDDDQTLAGTVKRSDRTAAQPVLLTRQRP